MQQRDFPSLLFFPNGEREFPSPSVFCLHREGIPLLFLLIMTLLFSPQEHWKVLFFFFFPCFLFSHKRVKYSPSFPSSFSEVKTAIFCRHSLYQFSALIFQDGNYFFFFASSECSILSYKNMKPDTHFKFGYWQL